MLEVFQYTLGVINDNLGLIVAVFWLQSMMLTRGR